MLLYLLFYFRPDLSSPEVQLKPEDCSLSEATHERSLPDRGSSSRNSVQKSIVLEGSVATVGSKKVSGHFLSVWVTYCRYILIFFSDTTLGFCLNAYNSMPAFVLMYFQMGY